MFVASWDGWVLEEYSSPEDGGHTTGCPGQPQTQPQTARAQKTFGCSCLRWSCMKKLGVGLGEPYGFLLIQDFMRFLPQI